MNNFLKSNKEQDYFPSTIPLVCVLICSMGFNIYLFWKMSETKGQVTAFSGQVVTADNQITDLQEQLETAQKNNQQQTTQQQSSQGSGTDCMLNL